MSFRLVSLIAASAAFFTDVSVSEAALFTPLGDFLGGPRFSYARNVSADGSTVVGERNDFPLATNQAYVWNATAGMVLTGDFPGGEESLAYAVSADGGTVVGIAESESRNEAFIWDAAEGIRGLGVLRAGTSSSLASAVSHDGTTVVGVNRSHIYGTEAFIWDAARGIRGLDNFPSGATARVATGVSGDGSVVVGTAAFPFGLEAFLWTEENGGQGLGRFPGAYSSISSAVSSDGSVAVGYGHTNEGFEAFIWSSATGMTGLGQLRGGTESYAKAVSGDGKVVVGSALSADEISEAILWDAANGMQELDVLLTSLGVDLTGWQLIDAAGISADGRTIVGTGINPDGEDEAWIAIVPEPHTALLLGLGLSGLGARALTASRDDR